MMGACGVFTMRYVSSFFCLHRTGWFRHFLVANIFLLRRAEHTGHPFDCPRRFTVPEVLQWCDAPRTFPRFPG